MPPVGFEPTITAGEWPKTYAVDRATTGNGTYISNVSYFEALSQNCEKWLLASCLPSAWNYSAPTVRIFMKFGMWIFSENRSRKLVKNDKNNGNFRLRSIYSYIYDHDYTLLTNLMHWLLFIHKILFSSTCFEPQVLIFSRIQLYTCSIWYCHSPWEFLVACRYTAWVRTDCRGKVVGGCLKTPTNNLPPTVSSHSSCVPTVHQELS